MRKWKVIKLVEVLLLLPILFLLWMHVMNEDVSVETVTEVQPEETSAEKIFTNEIPTEKKLPEEISENVSTGGVERIPISVQEIDFARISSTQIEIFWKEIEDIQIREYILKRRPAINNDGIGEWEIVQRIAADDKPVGGMLSVVDSLEKGTVRQYEYRVDVEVEDETAYLPEEGKTILASNLMICLDPGHYSGKNAVTGNDSYGYAEGDFTLALAEELRRVLKESYGIDSYMTRESGTITLEGYTDLALDKGHISLRGEYASVKESDLFVSLHTNANEEDANGYATCQQPIAINKTLVFLNQTAMDSEAVINVSNAVGMNLSKVNYQMGISTTDYFETAEPEGIKKWTKAYNDSLDTGGAVVCRMGDNGDYYGVLRGAANVGVPGIIIEHGMHTVAEVRREAMDGNLATVWAEADAYGIAYGFGFVDEMIRTDR